MAGHFRCARPPESSRHRLSRSGHASALPTRPPSAPHLHRHIRCPRFPAGHPASAVPEGATGLVIDRERRAVSIEGTPVRLTYREFELLAHLVAHPRRAHNRSQLMNTVWGSARCWGPVHHRCPHRPAATQARPRPRCRHHRGAPDRVRLRTRIDRFARGMIPARVCDQQVGPGLHGGLDALGRWASEVPQGASLTTCPFLRDHASMEVCRVEDRMYTAPGPPHCGLGATLSVRRTVYVRCLTGRGREAWTAAVPAIIGRTTFRSPVSCRTCADRPRPVP